MQYPSLEETVAQLRKSERGRCALKIFLNIRTNLLGLDELNQAAFARLLEYHWSVPMTTKDVVEYSFKKESADAD